MKPDEPFDPIAAQLKKAGDQKRQREAASKGEQLLADDFAEQARAAAPLELARVEAILKERGAAINASNVPRLPRLAFVKSAPSGTVSNSRLEAGKFAVELQPYQQLRQFTLTVIVGLHQNAAQFMISLPNIRSRNSTYLAAADDEGFFWTDTQHGGRFMPEQIVDEALERLRALLEPEV